MVQNEVRVDDLRDKGVLGALGGAGKLVCYCD